VIPLETSSNAGVPDARITAAAPNARNPRREIT